MNPLAPKPNESESLSKAPIFKAFFQNLLLPDILKPISWIPGIRKLFFALCLLVPTASFALIVSKGKDLSLGDFSGTFNGAPFDLSITFLPENPVDAVAKLAAEWISKGARPLPQSILWPNLKQHPFIEATFLSVLSGAVLQLPGKSLVAIFALSPAGGESGSQVGILRTAGPVTAVLQGGPGDPVMTIQLDDFLVRSYGAADKKNILDGLEREGWTQQSGKGENRQVFSKHEWSSYLYEDKEGIWSFFAFHSDSPRY